MNTVSSKICPRKLSSAVRWLPAFAMSIAVFCAQPAGAHWNSDNAVFRDLQHTILIRKAFLDDQQLAPLNIGVKVEDRIAYIWGSVPSLPLMEKSLQIAKQMPDIAEVRSKLYVEAGGGPLPGFSAWYAAAPKVQPIVQASASSPPGSSNASATVNSQWQVPPATNENTSYKTIENIVPVSEPSQNQVKEQDYGLFLIPSIAVQPGSEEKTTPKNLQEQVMELTANDWRYQYLNITVENQRVYLQGKVYQFGDVYQLAKKISQIANVENVVIGQIEVVPPS